MLVDKQMRRRELTSDEVIVEVRYAEHRATVPTPVLELVLAGLHADQGGVDYRRHKVKVIPAQAQLTGSQAGRLGAVSGGGPLSVGVPVQSSGGEGKRHRDELVD